MIIRLPVFTTLILLLVVPAARAEPVVDKRRNSAVAAIVGALRGSDHQHTRSTAISALGRIAVDSPLPKDSVTALVNAASADPYMTVRMDALELLVTLPLDTKRKQAVSLSLAQELIKPTPELWKRSSGLRSHSGLEGRAIELLATWFSPPYPLVVIEALLALSATHNPDRSLALLREVRSRGGLSDKHEKRLEEIAVRHKQPGSREAIYMMLTPGPASELSIEYALEVFESDDYVSKRIRAAYKLKRQFAEISVPEHVAHTADRVMHSSANKELRGIAAWLVSRGDEDPVVRERRLLSGLAQHDDAGIQQALLDLYGDVRLEELITRYAADASVSPAFRVLAINTLAGKASPDKQLAPETEEALKRTAWTSSEYWLINSLEKALIAWDIDRPFILHMKKKKNQTNFLFGMWSFCTILNLFSGLVAFVFLSRISLENGSWFKRRTVLAIGWIALSFGMLLLMALGFLGFLGHNYPPKPSDSLIINVPLYIGTVIYLTLVWVIVRRWRKEKR